MNIPVHDGSSHLLNEGDSLLADVVVRVQLPPSSYALGEQRYNTLAEWLERPDSRLRGRVRRVYGQGSMAIGATIAARATNDEFDVDAMVELLMASTADPQEVLDLVYESIRGEPGSRYYDMTVRCTRCVQVRYHDRMHVDLTPAVLKVGKPERESVIFHHRHETPSIVGEHVVANPHGFAQWFKLSTPVEPLFKAMFEDFQRVHASAETEPLPDQVSPHQASRALVCLQLIKRFRNLRYNHRNGRCPPSILLSQQVAAHYVQERGLGRALLSHAVNMRDIFKGQIEQARLLHAANPVCGEDVLTDRWPGSQTDQTTWLRDLEHLVQTLTTYVYGDLSLSQRQDILTDLFGETPAKGAISDFATRMGRDKEREASRFAPGTGRLIVPASPLVLPRAGRVEPRTSYFGGRLPWKKS